MSSANQSSDLDLGQGQGRRVAPPLVAILFYRAIKEYAEKGARLLASHCLWQRLVPFTPVIQAALAKLGLPPSNIPRLTGLNYLRSGGVTREGGATKNYPFKQRGVLSNTSQPEPYKQ